MASLLIVRRGVDIVGHCDQLCYDARFKKCTCVCESANHGVGLEQAIANTRSLHTEWLERARAAEPDTEFELGEAVQQFTLFPLDDA